MIPPRIQAAAVEYALDEIADLPERGMVSVKHLKEAVFNAYLSGALEMDKIYQREILPHLSPPKDA